MRPYWLANNENKILFGKSTRCGEVETVFRKSNGTKKQRWDGGKSKRGVGRGLDKGKSETGTFRSFLVEIEIEKEKHM